jgi:hypothetical protein
MHSAIAAIKKIRHTQYYPAILFAIFGCALLLRCWPRLASPQVWAEDGTRVLYGFINDGWATFFSPFNGYWPLIGKLVSAISLGLSIYHYPLISTVLTCLFTVFVGLAVALSPTVLRGRFFCALAMFLIPTDAEVYGFPLCAFWWAGVLLLLLVLWDERHLNPGWRTGFLLIGGLSSPIIIMLLPLLYWRAYFYRGVKVERWLALLATLIALLQVTYMAGGVLTKYPPLVSSLPDVVPKFFGGFLVGNIGESPAGSWLAGLLVIGTILLWFRHDTAHKGRWILLYLLVGAIAMSVVRVDPAMLSTAGGAPRYFFYPFVALFWILVQLYFVKAGIFHKSLAVLMAVLAILNLLPVVTRPHVDLEWQAHIRSCRLFPLYSIPVGVDGKQIWPGWEMRLKGEDCDKFLRSDRFVSLPGLERLPTFAYTIQGIDWMQDEAPAEVVVNTMTGRDFPPSARPGYRIIGSYNEAGSGEGELRLRLKKGASVLYRSGANKKDQSIQIVGYEQQFMSTVPAANDWIKLTFSNIDLPPEFVVRIRDAGAGPEQWSAVALPDAGSPPR